MLRKRPPPAKSIVWITRKPNRRPHSQKNQKASKVKARPRVLLKNQIPLTPLGSQLSIASAE
jgi:hypothetical protein